MLFRMFHHTQDYSLLFVHNVVVVEEVVMMLFDLMDRTWMKDRLFDW